jgi:hypothetical protein
MLLEQWSRRSVLALNLALGVVSLAACSNTPSDSAPEQKGTLELRLVTESASGATYRLRDAILIVQGPSNTLFFDTEEDPNQDVFSAVVVEGEYSVFLQEGWRLERTDGEADGGAPETAQARLDSPNPLGFFVNAGSSTQVPLRFQVGGEMVGSFEIGLEVEELNPEPEFCSSDAECASGETCCIAGFLGTCEALDGGACPLPDLMVAGDVALESIQFERQFFAADSCAIEESCVDAPGVRRLLRFSTETGNIGEADLVLGDPTTTPGFERSECHGHFHYEGYASYELLDQTGGVVATGHKQAFCLMDVTSLSGEGGGRFHCGFQGVSRGFADIYGSGLDCQWVDVTDVAAGEYVLRISVNTDRSLPESDYDNNVAEVPVTIVDEADTDPLVTCAQGESGPSRDCGWQFDEDFHGASCTPGEQITLGCGCGGGVCSGDTMIRVCEGTEACAGFESLGSNDDRCGLCSQLSVECPESGVYSVLVGPFSSGLPFVCDVANATPATAVVVTPESRAKAATL